MLEAIRGRLSDRTFAWCAFGAALGLASLVIYDRSGYGWPMLLLWLGGISIPAFLFRMTSAPLPRFERGDLLACGALMVAFAPLYLIRIYDWPVQVITDEPTIMQVSQEYSTKSDVDPFGVSDYWLRPSLLFMVWGRLGNLIGGIDLVHMRALHAVFGLIVLAACYTLFRQLLPRRWAVFASCLVGFSHAFFMISRLAMRENTAVLAEAVGLALLLRGLRHDHAFSTYCGGIVAGLGFYVYHPGRATFPLWVVFLVVLAVLYRDRYPLRQLARLGSIAAVGFVLMATPVVIAESKAPHSVGEAAPRAQLLIYPEGRELQKNWVFADSVWEGFKINVSFGLTAFNSDVVDHGWIYVNRGHGFVDPLTGILLWIGVAALALRFLRRRRLEDPLPLLMLGSFIVLWLSFAFIVNEAPKYPRLLITLPFVAYVVTESVRLLGRLLERGVARLSPARARRAGAAVAAGVLVAIAGGNLAIAWDFIDTGRKNGEPIGNTGRYIAAHPEEQIFLVADENGAYKYFLWGHPEWWASWMSWFAPDATLQATVESNGVHTVQAQRPFALLMSRALLTQSESRLRDAYPTGRIRNITPDGKLVVLEVPRST